MDHPFPTPNSRNQPRRSMKIRLLGRDWSVYLQREKTKGDRTGYYRVNGGEFRKKYLHRAVVLTLLKDHPSKFFPEGLPRDKIVHHMDHNGLHCCPNNLLIMDSWVHDYLAENRRCPYTGRYLTKREYDIHLTHKKKLEVPGWVDSQGGDPEAWEDGRE